MREIKFRAWDKKRNIYGKVTTLDIDDSDWFKERHAGHSGRVSLENPKNEKDCGSWGSWIEFVDLEQFTGRHDCRKEDLYEGDVLKDDAGNHGVVEWNEDDCSFNVRFDDEYQTLDSTVEEWGLKIGNIHENPELLK